jgi:hypothetical protein
MNLSSVVCERRKKKDVRKKEAGEKPKSTCPAFFSHLSSFFTCYKDRTKAVGKWVSAKPGKSTFRPTFAFIKQGRWLACPLTITQRLTKTNQWLHSTT